MWSFVDFKLDHFLVGVNEILIFVFVFQSIFEGELFDVASTIDFVSNLMKQQSYLFNIWPQIWLDFGKDQHSIDFYLEGAMPRKINKLLLAFIIVSLYLGAVSCTPVPMFGVVLWRLVLGKIYIFEDSFGLCGNFDEEFLIFFFIVSWAPVVEMAIDAVFYLDEHKI